MATYDDIPAEATRVDFKVRVERSKPKSWLKSVSAFANGVGGKLIFGVSDDHEIVGLEQAQQDSDFISTIIRERISPVPEFDLEATVRAGKTLLILQVFSGRKTPYYYRADGLTEAYIRVGSSSVPVPDYKLNELILNGQDRSYDALVSDLRKEDYSFTQFEATYRFRTGQRIEPTDYLSFGLTDEQGHLTKAGTLLADQPIVYNARIFCTRWNGLVKGSVFVDALDDKEFRGNLIYLLQNAEDFVRLHTKVRWRKTARSRIESPDYAERAVTEALVNALIHRDYILRGAEIHIDMYDDRLEIYSPGGMFDGKMIQECDLGSIPSVRRNPVIADLFNRMRYMERRGSGLRKIIEETARLEGYTEAFKPVFVSTPTDFRVVFKNLNYGTEYGPADASLPTEADRGLPLMEPPERPRQPQQKGTYKKPAAKRERAKETILAFCVQPRTAAEVAAHLDGNAQYVKRTYLAPLIKQGLLRMTLPNQIRSPNQQYVKA